ncbi:MAG: DUF3300 domain-containing protein [Syntrophobacteraceae bacterium]
MNRGRVFRYFACLLLVLLLTAPPGVFAAGPGDGKPFKQEQLEQILAPIALYPDALLAQVLMASTYPLEVVKADRWAKQNKKLEGDALTAALDKLEWDTSVKALVSFPQVLSMMSEKIDWTQNLGDAFIAQQTDVMNTVQKLRASARSHNNLKTTKEQTVIVEEKIIRIEPADPQVIYIPSYDPVVVYGAWPSPAYPPYYVADPVVAAGVGFIAGVAVGAAWSGGWGYWNWGGGTININVNPPHPPPGPPGPHPPGPPGPKPPGPGPHPPGPGPHPPGPGPHPQPPGPPHGQQPGTPPAQTKNWQHDPSHRNNVPYSDAATKQRLAPKSTTPAEARRDYRGHTPEASTRSPYQTGYKDPGRSGEHESWGSDHTRSGAFEGMGHGSDALEHSERGRMSREGGTFGGGGRSGFGGSGGFHGSRGRR